MSAPALPFVGVYRITEWRNLAHILEYGIFATNHVREVREGYVFIGDEHLTNRRARKPVKAPATGVLGDYVPFYFGKRSPMLYTLVRKGWAEERDVIYLLVKIQSLIDHSREFCFTDGHASKDITTFYTDLADLRELDVTAINARKWAKVPDDPDATRRKSAELLVKYHVPAACISGIAVKDERQLNNVKQIVSKSGLPDLPVAIRGDDYYYDL